MRFDVQGRNRIIASPVPHSALDGAWGLRGGAAFGGDVALKVLAAAGGKSKLLGERDRVSAVAGTYH